MAAEAMTPPREFYWDLDACSWIRCPRPDESVAAGEQVPRQLARVAEDGGADVRSG